MAWFLVSILTYFYLVPGMYSLMCAVAVAMGHEPTRWDEDGWRAYFWPWFVLVTVFSIAIILVAGPFLLLSEGREMLETWGKKK